MCCQFICRWLCNCRTGNVLCSGCNWNIVSPCYYWDILLLEEFAILDVSKQFSVVHSGRLGAKVLREI